MRGDGPGRLTTRTVDAVRGSLDLLRRLDRPLLAGFAFSAAATVLFIQLFDEVHEQDLMVRVDESASQWIAEWRGRGLSGLMRVVTVLADPWFVVLLVTAAAVTLLARRRRGAALFLVVATAGTGLLVLVAKLVTARPRPDTAVALISVSGYSFPSGHAAQSLALYGSLAIIAAILIDDRYVRVAVCTAALVLAFSVGISRVVLGVHWLSDIVAGWILAAVWLTVLLTGRRVLLLRSEQ